MIEESTKTIIRIIQDFCYRMNVESFVIEFSKSIAKKIVNSISKGSITLNKLQSICKCRMDFFYANELDVKGFCSKLLTALKKEFDFNEEDEIFSLIKEYKFKMEGGNLQGFPIGTKEDALRSDLANYLPYEDCYSEPRCSSGRCDMIISSKKTIVETKIWNGEDNYTAGIVELSEYLESKKFNYGFYVIFNYNVSPNNIMKSKGDFFLQKYKNINIYTIFIQMKKIPPSKLYRSAIK